MFKIDQFSSVDRRSIWNCRMFNAQEGPHLGEKHPYPARVSNRSQQDIDMNRNRILWLIFEDCPFNNPATSGPESGL
jgi:hypothetical protein